MKKTTSLLIVCGLLLGTGTLFAADGATKIGIIDLKKTFDSYWKTKQADSSLKESAADLDKARKGMLDDYQKSQDDYKKLLDNANDQAVATAEREKRKQAAEKKLLDLREIEQGINQFDRQARTTLGEKQRRMRDSILKEIRDKVNAKAKAKGFSLVVDVASETVNQTPVVLFSSGENDITDEIVTELNVNAPPLTPAAAAPEPVKPPAKK